MPVHYSDFESEKTLKEEQPTVEEHPTIEEKELPVIMELEQSAITKKEITEA